MARWLEYESRDTYLHRGLHPLTKLVVVSAVVILASLWWDPRPLLLLLCLGLIVVRMSQLPLKWFRFIGLAMLLALYPLGVVAVGQTNPEIFKVLDRNWASREIFTVDAPVAGRIGFTYGSVVWLAAAELRFLIVAMWMFVFIYTTSVSDIAATLLALRLPLPVVFVISLALRLVPYTSRSLETIIAAQRLRGWSGGGYNPITIGRQAIALARPLLRRSVTVVEQISMAVQIRGFGSGRVTPLREIRLAATDWVVVCCTISLLLAAVYLLVTRNIGSL
jgi:energy-coupling factor transport system permease protein